MASVSTSEFWTDLYARGGDGWELRQPAPPLVEFVARTPPPAPGRVAVPGCGRGHDVRHLARHGYAAVGFDFSAAAIAEARALAKADGVPAEFVERDIFTLGRDYERAFDGVWEYTCFCAIDPRRRAEYVQTMGTIIKPGGWLLACFFPMRRRAAGPPFPVAEREVRRLFASRFRFERAYLPRSVRLRQGQEWIVLLRRTNAPA
ncbi:MAG: SAM-dependent methyltransferase [Candidatus Rokuibacteriota bacterium]|nr:MAG: SAM-dependent methyltransferase [Candidatus Rokubacteria bacterium]